MLVALFYDWQALIAGVLGFAAAIVAVLMTLRSERRRMRNELRALRKALGVEIRQFTANARLAHLGCRELMKQADSPTFEVSIRAVEERIKLPAPQIYPSAVTRIGEFGDSAANIVLFYNRIAVIRDATSTLAAHPPSDHVSLTELRSAADGLLDITRTGVGLFGVLKTGIQRLDDRDETVVQWVNADIENWQQAKTN